MYINNAFLSIVPGNEAKAYAALGALAEAVKATQPDTWMYLIHTPNLDPGTNIYPPVTAAQIAFVEGYKDFDAYKAHHTSDVMKDFVKNAGGYFLNMYGPTVPFFIMQGLEMIDGFIRPEADVMTAWQVEARWVMKPGCREQVKAALKPYVERVRLEEPTTLMYTVSVTEPSEQAFSLPPSQVDSLTYNSSWTDKQSFFDHGSGAPYQDFLKEHGDLFVQAGAGSTAHPYMTTSVLKRFAGFFREEAFCV
jgi:quinol monooxygenase YgiN